MIKKIIVMMFVALVMLYSCKKESIVDSNSNKITTASTILSGYELKLEYTSTYTGSTCIYVSNYNDSACKVVQYWRYESDSVVSSDTSFCAPIDIATKKHDYSVRVDSCFSIDGGKYEFKVLSITTDSAKVYYVPDGDFSSKNYYIMTYSIQSKK